MLLDRDKELQVAACIYWPGKYLEMGPGRALVLFYIPTCRPEGLAGHPEVAATFFLRWILCSEVTFMRCWSA